MNFLLSKIPVNFLQTYFTSIISVTAFFFAAYRETKSIIEEAILFVSFGMLLKKLTSEGLRLFAHPEQIDAPFKKWEKTLSKIPVVLEDAEGKQVTEQSVKIWLGELQNLAYDLKDIMDELDTEALQRKLLFKPDQPSTSKAWKLIIRTCCSNFNTPSLMFNASMRYKLKDSTTKLQEIDMEKEQLILKGNSGERSKKVRQRLPTTSVVNEAKVYRRENHNETILQLLLNDMI